MEGINEAIHLLRTNGYIVKKFTKSMSDDCLECERMQSNGEDMECLGCSCSVCMAH